MTIAVTVRTGSAIVFAADSKVTTVGIIGRDEDGKPRFVDQTYDNAIKIVSDHSQTAMAMIAGHANIGQEAAMDFFMSRDLRDLGTHGDQDERLSALIDSMVDQKKKFWESVQIPEENWRGPVIMLAAPSPTSNLPRVWRIDLDGPGSDYDEVVKEPSVYLEGSYRETFGLLYGYDWDILGNLMAQLGVEVDKWQEAVRNLQTLRPIDKLNLWAMPLQDAIELSFFLATVQVQMDRFLPGTPVCGGPIDVMVLQTVPTRAILSFPGKRVHHPLSQ